MKRSKRCKKKKEEEGKFVVLSLQEERQRLGCHPAATFSGQIDLKQAINISVPYLPHL